jgi:hypothetical protein
MESMRDGGGTHGLAGVQAVDAELSVASFVGHLLLIVACTVDDSDGDQISDRANASG